MDNSEIKLSELKAKSPTELLTFAEELEIEGATALRRQDMMFAVLKELADRDVEISGGGVLIDNGTNNLGDGARAGQQGRVAVGTRSADCGMRR